MAPEADGDSNGSKNPTKPAKSQKKGDDVYLSAARTIARCVDLWCDVDKIIKLVHLLQDDEASKCGDLDEDDAAREVREEYLSKVSQESCDHATRIYYKLIQMIPNLRTVIDDPARGKELAGICAKINADIRSTRSNDASRLKNSISRYCLPNPDDPTSLLPPVIVTKTRAELGLNHPILARWLCPVDQLQRFDEDPERARKDLASGVIPMESEDFPALFFSGAMPGEHYDPELDDVLPGLFRSYLLIRIARHIFLGPSFAIDDAERKTRSSNAILNDVTTIEAEHIAYVCVQARFAISSKEQWNEMDGDLNYCDMYRAIIQFIKKASDPAWREDLLQWWNMEIFRNKNGRGNAEKKARKDGNSAPRMSTMERLQAQMQARLAPLPEVPGSSESDFALDPLLSSSGASTCGPGNVLSQQDVVASTSSLCDARNSENAQTLGRFAASDSTHIPSTSTSARQAPLMVTPPQARISSTAPDSPLSDEEGSIPLTPITNRKGKQPAKSAKAAGKRPVPRDDEDGMALGSRNGRRAKRSRK